MTLLSFSLLLSIALAHSPAEAKDVPSVARCEATDNPGPFSGAGATRVVILDFDVSARGGAPADGARIADHLCRALGVMVQEERQGSKAPLPLAELELLRVSRPVASYAEARAIGQALGADVVLWGNTSCEAPTGERVLKASDEAAHASAKAAGRRRPKRARPADRVAVAADGALDAEALQHQRVCVGAALVGWDLLTNSTPPGRAGVRGLADVHLGSFTMSDPQGALDLTLALRFGHQRAPDFEVVASTPTGGAGWSDEVSVAAGGTVTCAVQLVDLLPQRASEPITITVTEDDPFSRTTLLTMLWTPPFDSPVQATGATVSAAARMDR